MGSRRIEWMELRSVLVYDMKDRSEVIKMRPARKAIDPEDYILSVLSPEDRLDAAFKIAREAFKGTKLTMKDIDNAVKSVRRKTYRKKEQGRHTGV
jgi:GH35 family endo-1,4-beta-xylanase